MQALRDEIRAILREELAALREPAAAAPAVEPVRIVTDSDLNRFALSVLERASDPQFAHRLRSGALRFLLAAAAPSPLRAVAAPVDGNRGAPGAGASEPALHKSLITERDIAALPHGQRHLRIGPGTRLTPLARDEARRLGIRIERYPS
jgi:hypothetical protein